MSSNAADYSGITAANTVPGTVNVRQAFIQGISTTSAAQTTITALTPVATGFGTIPNGTVTFATFPGAPTNNNFITQSNPKRRYQIQFALGLFNQPKLIPTKFMASQLSIEITLANPSECMYVPNAINGNPTYQVSNVNLIPEILEFDASYGI